MAKSLFSDLAQSPGFTLPWERGLQDRAASCSRADAEEADSRKLSVDCSLCSWTARLSLKRDPGGAPSCL